MKGWGNNEHLTTWACVAGFTALALALRVAAAQGGLWTDEAWSAVFAEQAGNPLGVFTGINHDNNHVLNTLWLQLVGVTAPPWLSRLPAIITGTAAVPLAGSLFIRRSRIAAVAAAGLFAASPIMVVYGSEARGYAPMMLAALLLIKMTIDAPDGDQSRATPWLRALAAAVGTLAQMTMVAPVVLLSAWVFLEKRLQSDFWSGVRHSLRIMGPAIAVAAGVVLLVTVPATLSPTGLQTGGYNPFTTEDYLLGIANLQSWTLGWTFLPHWLALVVLLSLGTALIFRSSFLPRSRSRLYGILILGVPVVILAERFGNAQFSRFYLCTAIALLLLAAEWIGHSARAGRANAVLCGAALLILTGLAGQENLRLIKLQRGQPERSVQLMARQAPNGASIDVQDYQLMATMRVAARQANYPIAVVEGCAPARYLFVKRRATSPDIVERCGRPMRAIGRSEVTDLTGDAWVLYGA